MNRWERNVFHVVHDASARTWVVTQENSALRVEFDTKHEAERFADRRAEYAGIGQIKVHKKLATWRLRQLKKQPTGIFRAKFLRRLVTEFLESLLHFLMNLKKVINEKHNSV